MKVKSQTPTIVHTVKRMPELTQSHASTIIVDAESRISTNMVKLQQLTEPLKEAEELWRQAKLEYDTVKAKLDEDTALLDLMTRYKNGLSEKKGLRVLRSESHNDMKPREKKKLHGTHKFHWKDWGAEVLKLADHFMTPDDLFYEVVRRKNLEPEFKSMGKSSGYFKWSAIKNCWAGNCQLSAKNKHGNNAMLITYKDMIGLVKWVGDDLKPLPQYNKPFAISIAS